MTSTHSLHRVFTDLPLPNTNTVEPQWPSDSQKRFLTDPRPMQPAHHKTRTTVFLACDVYNTPLLSRGGGGGGRGESVTLRAVGPALSNSMFMVLPFISQWRGRPGRRHTEISSSCALSAANWCLGTISLMGTPHCSWEPRNTTGFSRFSSESTQHQDWCKTVRYKLRGKRRYNLWNVMVV